MTCWLLEVTLAQITALRSDPPLADNLAETTQDGSMDRGLAEGMKRLAPEVRAKMEEQYRQAQRSFPGYAEHEAKMAKARARLTALGTIAEPLYLEKAWHVLHYVFTGHADGAEAPGNALLSGQPMAAGFGYGPTRLHSPGDARAFAEFLSRQEVARLQSRVNLAEMGRLQIYPILGEMDADEEAAGWRETIATQFPRLAAYVGKAAAHGSGLLTWLS